MLVACIYFFRAPGGSKDSGEMLLGITEGRGTPLLIKGRAAPTGAKGRIPLAGTKG